VELNSLHLKAPEAFITTIHVLSCVVKDELEIQPPKNYILNVSNDSMPQIVEKGFVQKPPKQYEFDA
jgi:hypothetical protein